MTAGGNELTGAEAMVRMLQAHGVKHIFGLCGDTTLPLYDALYRLDHGMEHILTRDERHAAYMADAYARVSGKVGVCEGPSGGGATYILPGLVEANESSVPILGITTDVSVSARGRYPLTELDQNSLFKPLTKWNTVIDQAERLPAMVRSAFRAMTTGRPGSAHIGLPFDVQKAAVPENEVWAQAELGSYPAWRAGPAFEAVERMVEALLSAKNPMIICGGGVVISGAESELQSFAEALNVTVATTISGQGSLADSHPLCLGVVGSNGGVTETREVVEEADLVLFIGCRAGSVTTERWRCPKPGQRILHIDVDPMVISANYETEVALNGDAQLALRMANEVLAKSGEQRDFGGAARIAKARRIKFADFEERAASNDSPIRPERVVATLGKLLDDDAVVVADPGTPCPFFSAFYQNGKAGRQFITNRAHGALGYSAAAVLGAHYGRPGAKCVSVMGDGSFGFTVGEYETVMRKNLPVTYVVFSNSVYGWIKAGQKSGFGERYYSVDFSRSDHAGIAAAYGLKTWRVEDPADLEGAMKAALEADGPTLVDVIAQPLQDANAPVSEWVA